VRRATLGGRSYGRVEVRKPMHRVTLDFANAVIELVAEGAVDQSEMTEVFSEMREAAYKLQGRAIKCFIDLRQTTISSPEMAQRIKEHQQAMAKLGMQRVAEVVTSSLLALQMNRVAREAGVHERVQRFSDADVAKRWLLSGVRPDDR
jgi:hypothetical protein